MLKAALFIAASLMISTSFAVEVEVPQNWTSYEKNDKGEMVEIHPTKIVDFPEAKAGQKVVVIDLKKDMEYGDYYKVEFSKEANTDSCNMYYFTGSVTTAEEDYFQYRTLELSGDLITTLMGCGDDKRQVQDVYVNYSETDISGLQSPEIHAYSTSKLIFYVPTEVTVKLNIFKSTGYSKQVTELK